MRKIEINKRVIEEIFEKKKHEKDKSNVTKNANLNILISSIFFPTQINKKLLNKVADAQIVPNCPWVIDSASRMLELKRPRKKLCPKLEKNVKINPKTITFKLKLLNIKNYEL